jgi:hypothetical protein
MTAPMIDIAAERVLSIVPGNGGQKGITSKLANIPIDSPDYVYMLAAFSFDLFRRLQYMYKLAQQFSDRIPSDIAREILADHDALNAEGLSWKQRAEAAEAVMLRLHGELADSWEANLKVAAGGGAQG